MKKRMIPLFLCLLLLAGCEQYPEPKGDRAEFDAFVAEVDAARAANTDWTQEEKELFEAYAPDTSDQADVVTQEELEGLFTPKEVERVSREEALEDIDLFFRLLKSAYGGYEYFGGDEAFLAAKEEVLSRFAEERSYAARDVGIELRTALEPFVQDGHFNIGGRPVLENRQYMYYVPDLYFTDATGLDMDYVKPTIGPDGALAYCFAALSEDKKGLPKQIGSEQRLEWVKSEPLTDFERVAYRRTEERGVTVLQCRTMTATEEWESQLERLAHAGADYQELPTFIVDIRGNNGGSDDYGKAWVEGFTGEECHQKGVGGQRMSTAYQAWGDSEDAIARMGANAKEFFSQIEVGTFAMGVNDGARSDNDSPVFVLTDKNAGSAAEGFLYALRTVDKVVAVGSNTTGSINFGNVMAIYLPNTGIGAAFGTKFGFREAVDSIEGVGILPDLWVNPADAQDAVLRLIDYYGLRD